MALLFSGSFLLLAQPAKIAIMAEFEQPAAKQTIRAMQQQAADLLKSAGVELAWPGKLINPAGFQKVIQVRFQGSCRAGDFASLTALDSEPFGTSSFRLAAAKLAGREVLPKAVVECDNVRRALHYVPFPNHATELGKALARVLTHELYHILGGTTHHEKEGLAKAIVKLEEIVRGDLSLGETTSGLIGQRLRN